jgi:MFS family permease
MSDSVCPYCRIGSHTDGSSIPLRNAERSTPVLRRKDWIVPFTSSLGWATALIALYFVVQGVFYPIGANCLARLTPSRFMGKLTGLYLVFQGGAAAALGPTLVALAGEHLFVASGPRTIGYGIALVAGCILLIALALLVSWSRHRTNSGRGLVFRDRTSVSPRRPSP